VNAILAIPLPARLALLFGLGVALGGLINLAIYRWAWNRRSISPWSAPLPKAPARKLSDRLPIIGWLGLRREAGLHGRGFWIRPLLVELGTGSLFAALYWWEVARQGLLLPVRFGPMPPGFMPADDLLLALHVQFAAHLVLVSLMLVATFIDIDEKTIPDMVTVPGTLFGLAAAALFPWSLLPGDTWAAAVGAPPLLDFLRLSTPQPWPAFLQGAPSTAALLIALGCWWMWCFALLPRRWNGRRGWRTALRLILARLGRSPLTWRILLLGIVGMVAITAVWNRGHAASWAGLLSSLVGMAAGGGIIWLVRIIGSLTLGREAMGFGDVTLLAMIGTLVGWQACLLIFFIAPFAGLVIAGVQWMFHGGREIPYGPFLCLATLLVIVRWSGIWDWAWGIFSLGLIVPAGMAACLLLLGLLLGLWRLLLTALGR